MQDPTFQTLLTDARRGDLHALERVLVRSRQDLRRYAEYHCAVNDVEELSNALQILLTEPDTHTRASRAANAVVAQGVGAADRSTALVEGLLFSQR